MHEYLSLIAPLLQSPTNQLNPYYLGLVVVVGLIIGSYLNVVIYRGSAKYLPQETKYKGQLDTCHPKNSFCPQCLHPLSWVENIPLISWIIQGGKCKHCKGLISPQYPAVEATNAILWAVLWILCPTVGEFLVYATFTSILIAVTCIDLKVLRIPNKITVIGIAILVALWAAIEPDITKVGHVFLGILGAGLFGYALVELGKMLFGQKKVKLKTLTEFVLNQKEKTLTIKEDDKTLEGSEPISTDELFIRNSDKISISGEIDNITNKKPQEQCILIIQKDTAHIEIKNKSNPTKTHKEIVPHQAVITGKIKEITLPQEALGMGDVKLLMLISAALGYPNFIYAMTLGAILGLIYGGTLRVIAIAKKANAPSLIAFGPWLSLGSILTLLWVLSNAP
jgi:prepilin signal peptidase PulO-like enzyme (type II secretory pathway)